MASPLPAYRLAPVQPLATASATLVVAACAAEVFGTWTNWNRYLVARDYVASTPGVGLADLVSADNVTLTAGVIELIAYLGAGVVFLSWLWRARVNAERIGTVPQRLSRGWTTGGWFCPVVNLWFPLVVVEDIWRASGTGRRGPLVRVWWYAWVANALVAVWLRVVANAEPTVPVLGDIAAVDSLGTVLSLFSGTLIVLVMRQISEWQSTPRG